MKTTTLIGWVGITATVVVKIVEIVIETREYRNGNRRINKKDIELIAEAVYAKQKEEKEWCVINKEIIKED